VLLIKGPQNLSAAERWRLGRGLFSWRSLGEGSLHSDLLRGAVEGAGRKEQDLQLFKARSQISSMTVIELKLTLSWFVVSLLS